MEYIKEKSESWRQAIAREVYLDAKQHSLVELLSVFFENSPLYDEQAYKSLKRKYGLDNTITDDEFKHSISGVVLHTFKLCKEVYKYLPDRMEKRFQYLKSAKEWNKYLGYLTNHSEKAVVNVVRSMSASIVEVDVETDVLEAEILYWNKGQIFVLNFVPELDEDVDTPLSIHEL